MSVSLPVFFLRLSFGAIVLVFAISLESCTGSATSEPEERALEVSRVPVPPGMQKAILAGGCFWGVESALQKIPGVVSTTVGYTGGQDPHPTYPKVCEGTTGHAEAVEVIFDPAQISYEALLLEFFRIHPASDPKTQTFHGGQYRSAIFYCNDEQKSVAERVKSELEKDAGQLCTEIKPAAAFIVAEDFHQDYERNHGDAQCRR